MKSSMRLTMLVLVMANTVACGDGMAPSGGKRSHSQEGVPQGGVVQDTGGGDAAALAAYTETVYPLVTEHCAQCHASTVSPNFAHTDAAQAKSITETSSLANLEAAEQSRLVKRLSEQAHNCWGDCAANATEMTEAIVAWAAAAGSAGPKQEFIKTTPIAISAAAEVSLKGGHDKTWVRAAAYSDGYGDLLAPLEISGGTLGKVLFRIPDYATLPDPKPQGGAQYLFDIPESDTEKYQLCFRIRGNITLPGGTAPTNTGANRVVASVNGKTRFLDYDLSAGTDVNRAGVAAQVNTNYVWVPAFYQNDPANGNTPTPTAVNLKPMTGSRTMRLDILDSEPAIDLIALTGISSTCAAAAKPNAGRVFGFQYDLSSALGGKKATLTIQYSKTADGLGFHVFTLPTLEIEDPTLKVQIEGLYIVINDTIDRQLNTFASVKAAVQGGAQLSSAPLIVPLGAATDTVSVYISKLSIVP